MVVSGVCAHVHECAPLLRKGGAEGCRLLHVACLRLLLTCQEYIACEVKPWDQPGKQLPTLVPVSPRKHGPVHSSPTPSLPRLPRFP